MPKANQVNWQPISQMPLISSMIDTSLNDTREHLGTLSKAKDQPHVLDDATIDRVEPGPFSSNHALPRASS